MYVYEWRCDLSRQESQRCSAECEDATVRADVIVLWSMVAFLAVLICLVLLCRIFKIRYPGLEESPPKLQSKLQPEE